MNKQFIRVCVSILPFLCFAATIADASVVDANLPEKVCVTVDVNAVINKDLMGVGWNVCPLYIPSPRLEDDNEDLKQFFKLFKETRQPWIRLVVTYYEWECTVLNDEKIAYANDDNDPWTKPQKIFNDAYNGFVWSAPKGLDWRIRYMLDFCEKNGIDVEVSNWETQMKRWLDHARDPNGNINYDEALAKAQEFGENVASLVYFLKTKANNGKGYNCVKYYAIWNEPGGGYPGQDFITFDFPGYANLLHKAVREHLEFYDKHMQTQVTPLVKCIGFESFPTHRKKPGSGGSIPENWPQMLAKGVLKYDEPQAIRNGQPRRPWPDGGPYMDIISIHDYWATFDYDAQNPSPHKNGVIKDYLLKDVVGLSLKQIQEYADHTGTPIKPLVLSEIGSFVHCAEATSASYDHALYVAEVLVRAFPAGIKGASAWAWNMHTGFGAVSYPQSWWEVEPKGKVHPINANYYPYSLLTRTVRPGSSVLATTVSGGLDDTRGSQTWQIVNTQRVWACAFRTGAGQIDLVVINDSYLSKKLNIPALKPFISKQYVTSEKYDRIYEDIIAVGNSKTLDNIVLPRSIVVYSMK